ncbi:MAG: metallophosphoesterase family protein [Bacteroidaceae bacterium]|jgi:putative phosphoesterase|nr:metallophosphoesterase family protein [Bacteroidaceae bacterium]
MKRIGILSDTHGYWDDKYLFYFADCDEVWHAGDIGTPIIIELLEKHCTVRAVCGNIDGGDLNRRFSKVLRFKVEECDVLMTHIGGYPGKYAPTIRKEIYSEKPNLFVAGHSHILKVMYDRTLDCLHVNPGAAGKQGWQQVRTLVKLTIDGKDIKNLEVIELS